MSNAHERLFAVARRVVDSRHMDSLTPASLLLDEHILDSFGIIQLIAQIDNEFSIAIKTEDLTSQNFATITDIAGLVERYIDNGQ